MCQQKPDLYAEVNDGHVGIVEAVEHVRLAKVELLELYVVHVGVGDPAAGKLDLVKDLFPLLEVLGLVEVNHTGHVQPGKVENFVVLFNR